MNKDITAEQLFYLGMEHYDKGDLKKAQDFLQEADNKSPGRLSILVNLITIMHQQNKWDESLNTCERLLELFPNESSSWEKFANYLFGLSQYNESIEFYSNALSLKKDESLYFNRALAFEKICNFEFALADISAALKINPFNIDFSLAKIRLLLANNLISEAVLVLDEIENSQNTSSNIEFLKIKVKILLLLNKTNESFLLISEILKTQNRNPEIWHLLGNAQVINGEYENSIISYKKAISLSDSSDVKSLWNLSLTYLFLQNFSFGWELYSYGWEVNARGHYYGDKSSNLYTHSLGYENILIWGEQGIGDQILHASMINDFYNKQNNKIILALDSKLIPLFQNSFSQFQIVDRSDLKKVSFSSHMPLGNLGSYVRNNISDFPITASPYLFCDNVKSASLKKKLGAPDKVICGISWRSDNQKIGEFKSLSLCDLSNILKIDNVTFVNLQYGDTSLHESELNDCHGLKLFNVSDIDKFNDIKGLADIIGACDFIITTSNTTAHLAGAMGIKGWVLIPFSVGSMWYWHINTQNRSLWYPNLTIVRKSKDSGWKSALSLVESFVTEHLKSINLNT